MSLEQKYALIDRKFIVELKRIKDLTTKDLATQPITSTTPVGDDSELFNKLATFKNDRIELRGEIIAALSELGKNIHTNDDKIIEFDRLIKTLKQNINERAASAGAATGALHDVNLLHRQQLFGNTLLILLCIAMCYVYYRRDWLQKVLL